MIPSQTLSPPLSLSFPVPPAVLKDFYFKTNPGLFGSHNKRDWISADKWLSKDVTHCLWEGITCTKNGSVLA